nr:transposase [Bradyrhizobium sp. 2]
MRREERRERLRKKRSPVSKDKRCRAVQAFWTMHVEAMRWCGLSMQAYARAHGISQHSLRRWRDLIDANEVEIDWRTQLHPSARPLISTSVSSAAKGSRARSRLTDAPAVDPPSDERANRRRFSEEEKLAIVTQSELPGATAAEVCRRHGIVTSMLFRWRVQFGFSKRVPAKLAAVRVAGAQSATLVLNDLLQPPDGMTVVELDDGRRVFAPIGSDPDAVRRHVIEQETAR